MIQSGQAENRRTKLPAGGGRLPTVTDGRLFAGDHSSGNPRDAEQAEAGVGGRTNPGPDSPPSRDVPRSAQKAGHRTYVVIVGLIALGAILAVGTAAAGLAVHGAGLAPSSLSFGVNGVAFSPDGTILASADSDGTIRLWNPATRSMYGPVLRAGPGSRAGVTGVAFSPDGKLLASADADGTIQLWNPATGQAVHPPLVAGSSVAGVAFSPDGKLLASADADWTVKLWNPATGQAAYPPLLADGGVTGVAFSPDGKLLASADADGTIQLWNPATGLPVGVPLPAGGSVTGVAFSPDGKLLASADADGTIQLWNPATSQPASPESGGWFVVVASVIALALSALALAMTAREIQLAGTILESGQDHPGIKKLLAPMRTIYSIWSNTFGS